MPGILGYSFVWQGVGGKVQECCDGTNSYEIFLTNVISFCVLVFQLSSGRRCLPQLVSIYQ